LKLADNYRRCLYFNDCKQEEHYNGKKWKKLWYRYQDSLICEKHYDKLITNPKLPKGWSRKYHEKDILFLKKRLRLSWIIRTGYCSICSNNIHNGSCKLTSMHHWFYLPIMVWACTEERCNSCHAIITRKRKNEITS